MWVFFSDNINRERCACSTMLAGEDKGKVHHCQSCGRTWEQVSCDWWARKRPEQLIPGPHWEYALVEVVCFDGKVARKYLATNTESRMGVLLDSVSNIQEVIGAGEQLMHWGVMQTLREATRPWWSVFLSDEEAMRAIQVPAKNGGMRVAESFSQVLQNLPPHARAVRIEATLDDMANTLDRAVHARRHVAQLAAEYGTRAHELIHSFVTRGGTWDYPRDGQIYTTPWEQEEPPVVQAISNFLRFWGRENLELVSSEVVVADIQLGVAGTLDALVKDPAGNLVMLDWKTSKSMREKYLIQVAAYCRMHEKMGLGKIARAYIVRIDKESAALQIVPAFQNEAEYKEILLDYGAALRLHRFQKRAQKHFRAYGTEILDEEVA